jgi:hypothetical protein
MSGSHGAASFAEKARSRAPAKLPLPTRRRKGGSDFCACFGVPDEQPPLMRETAARGDGRFTARQGLLA